MRKMSFLISPKKRVELSEAATPCPPVSSVCPFSSEIAHSKPGQKARVCLNITTAHPGPLLPRRVTILSALEKKRNPRALTPYPFKPGAVKTPEKRKGFHPVFQVYMYSPSVPTKKGAVRGQIFGLVPYNPSRVEPSGPLMVVEQPILPLPNLEGEEYEVLKTFYKTAKARGLSFANIRNMNQLILDLVRSLEIEDNKKAKLINAMTRYAKLQSILRSLPMINMSLEAKEMNLLKDCEKVLKEEKRLHLLDPVDLYCWILEIIHGLKVPEKDQFSVYLCMHRYIYNKTYPSHVIL